MAAVQPNSRTRALYLFQLGASTTNAAAKTWLTSFRTKLPLQESTARLVSALVGAKGGVVVEIYAANPATAVSKTVTALGAGTPTPTLL